MTCRRVHTGEWRAGHPEHEWTIPDDVFPQGSTHTEWNPDCTDAVFVAGFNSDDPGVRQDAQTTFGLSDEVVGATFGFKNGIIEGVDLDKRLLPCGCDCG